MSAHGRRGADGAAASPDQSSRAQGRPAQVASPLRRRMLELARSEGAKWYDASTRRCLIARDTLWYAAALVCSDAAADRALGSELLAATPCEDVTHAPATMLALLLRIPDLLGTAARAHLEAEVRRTLPESMLQVWHDGNVNHPLAAWCVCVLGGERFDVPEAVHIGMRRLEDFRRTIGDRRHAFHRQSTMPEYMSPTYTAVTLWWLALLAEHTRDARARRIARFLEERLWLEVALHWHAPSQQWAGPSSRSYLDDSLGCWSALHCTFAVALDEAGDPRAADLLLDPTIAHSTGHASSLVENALVVLLPFHLPLEAVHAAFDTSYPRAIARVTYGEVYHENSARSGFDDSVYPGGWSELRTHMTRGFALGTASRPYINAAQSDAISLRIARRTPPRSRADQRSMFVRSVFNDARAARANAVHVTGGMTDASYLYEEGRTAVLQHGGLALVLVAPKRMPRAPFTGFRTDLLFTHDAPFDELSLDGRIFEDLELRGDATARVLFRDRSTAGAVLPLAIDPHPGEASVRLWRHDALLVCSLVNHEGPAITIDPAALGAWRNGFLLAVADVDDDAAMAAFRAHVHEAVIDDRIDAHGVRRVEARFAGTTLGLAWHPLSEEILTATVDGRDARVQHVEGSVGTLYGHEAWECFQHDEEEET